MTGFRPALDISGYNRPREVERYDMPERAGDGPLEASSCVTLVVVPEVIWDVNGYYRALGFAPPFLGITRKDLRLAFHDLRGEESVYLTSILRLLLNAEERRAYDCAPFGERHMDSLQQKLLLEQVKRQAARESPSTDTRATQHEIFKRMGLEAPEASPDEQYPDGEDNEASMVHTEPLPLDQPWRWGYYRWGTGRADVSRLDQWQKLLVSQLVPLEVMIKFGVGFIGRGRTDSRFVVARTYGVHTVYLREDLEPDEEMAIAAAKALRSDLTE